MYRSTRLIHDYDISLVFVFDGIPPQLKKKEIRRRREQRNKAAIEREAALKSGDFAKAFSKAVMTSRLTRRVRDRLGVRVLTIGDYLHVKPGKPVQFPARVVRMVVCSLFVPYDIPVVTQKPL